MRLVALALLIALLGAAGTVQLFSRIGTTNGGRRLGWVLLCSVGTGTMVWSTHFVAMMAYVSRAPVMLDATMTMASLAIAILVAAPGLALAAAKRGMWTALGGGVVGVAIAAMHYVGMSAYRIDGFVVWRDDVVALSIALSCGLSAAAFVTFRSPRRNRRISGGLLLAAAVVALHFTGMSAFTVVAIGDQMSGGLSEAAQMALGYSTACAGLLFVGCASVSALIDGQTQTEAFQRLRRMAMHDGLTDLPNRASFHEELNQRLSQSKVGDCVAVVMLDLSRFKGVNDTYGHQAGDQLLVALAERLRAMLLPAEAAARLGGDEFSALLSFSQHTDLDDFIFRLASVFEAPFVFQHCVNTVGANIGIAVSPRDGLDADALLAHADLAMYRAKARHSGVPCFYDAEMDDAERDRRILTEDLRQAIREKAFYLEYQVQASIGTGEVIGYEALVRWRHPSRGLVSPSIFIPLAEEAGEIVALSNWIIHRACLEAALRPELGRVSVNISPLHLSDPDLVGTVQAALGSVALPADRLALELTESAIIHDRHASLAQLRMLKAMGVAIMLDDFGVGFSSLDVLRSFPFDRLKLDRSFVAEIEDNRQAIAILHAVTTLAASLDIPVLAEGVETAMQLEIVAREGCAAIQGFLIGRPAIAAADRRTVQLLMKRQSDAAGVVAA